MSLFGIQTWLKYLTDLEIYKPVFKLKIMKKAIGAPFWIFLLTIFVCFRAFSQNEEAKQEILHNGEVIRQAFADEDLEKIKSLHHPDVIKALGFNDLKVGRAEVIEGLKETLKSFTLTFIENDVESILVRDNIAIEQTKFAIKGTPKEGGDPFVFKGRTMVTYVRYDKSPTGWATIREIIQPATD